MNERSQLLAFRRMGLGHQQPQQKHSGKGHCGDAQKSRRAAKVPDHETRKRGAQRSADPRYRSDESLREIKPARVGSVTGVQQIATRQKCSVRQVNMTISLAFLAPALVRAAVEGRLPRGIGVERLRDAPAEWSRQFEALGLNPR